MKYTEEDIKAIVDAQRAYFRTGVTLDVKWRFGGTGHSGMGAYHGEWGFREFTHPSTVLNGCTHFNLPLREHPYSGRAGSLKLKLLRLFER